MKAPTKIEAVNAVNVLTQTITGTLNKGNTPADQAAAKVVDKLGVIILSYIEMHEPSKYFDLYEALDRVKREQKLFQDGLDADTATQEDIVQSFDVIISDLEYYIERREEQIAEENPIKSDWEEHNTMNKVQQGLK